jgi:hypothetical protein
MLFPVSLELGFPSLPHSDSEQLSTIPCNTFDFVGRDSPKVVDGNMTEN